VITALLGTDLVGQFVRYVTGSGVELFFCISGIVLLRPYVRGEREFRLTTYLQRRIMRIWPAYLAALAVSSAVIGFTTIYPTWYSKEVLPTFSWTAVLSQTTIFKPASVPTYNAAWWSLEVEVVFYLLAPVAVCLLRKPPKSIWATVLLLITSYLVGEVAWKSLQPGQEALVQVFAAYLPCFAAGVLVAKCDLKLSVGLLMTLASAQLGAWAALGANVHTAFAFAYLGLVMAVIRPGSLNAAFSSNLAVWIGERSYSIFLVHFPALYVGNNIAAMLTEGRDVVYFVISRAIGLPLAGALSLLVFTLVERRFARGLVTADQLLPRLRRRPHQGVVQ
jgi:peptidoglycan/LPS O-acetylase OafA/YrhL